MLTLRASPISSSELDRLGFSEGGGGEGVGVNDLCINIQTYVVVSLEANTGNT